MFKAPDPINDNARHNSELFLVSDLVPQISGGSNLQQLCVGCILTNVSMLTVLTGLNL